ncbi:type II secretion system protein GspM [Vibrio hepatarius]|uniref:type II secretion system protein GspM n=1 Tax=Vibrio hepatarius TaxID=171383 RepID=UPI001C0A20F7|nr:type II secretion system protein GspM [Vibrio hepatarius]MBU2898776.1 type II secretion system protein M [Vibrio hepatarius]
MNRVWDQLGNKFSELNQREKVLLAICGLVVVVLTISAWLIEPTLKSNHELKRQVMLTSQNLQSLEADILVVTAKLKKDPNENLNMEYKKLLIESQRLSEKLALMIESFISPSLMAELLEGVLGETQGLKLVLLESLKAQPIVGGVDNQTQTEYYVHPVKIELTGSYFSILTYLKTLESMPVHYYWNSFSYKVETYPNARVILEVYTLGTRQEFIGG